MVKWQHYQCHLFGGGVVLLYILIHNWHVDVERNFIAQQQDVRALQQEVDQLQRDVSFVQENQKKYESLVTHGWFQSFDRLKAVQVIEDTSKSSGLTQVYYDFSVLDSSQCPVSTKGNDVRLTFSGPLDSSVFEFIEKLSEKWPGYILPESISLMREGELNDYKHPFVSGEYHFHWLVDAQGDR